MKPADSPSSSCWRVLRVELKDGHELDGGDTEILKVGDFLNQAGVCTAFRRRDARVDMASEAFHMEFVNYGVAF
jgi:hypothetical protein